jgi:hypothetical protein
MVMKPKADKKSPDVANWLEAAQRDDTLRDGLKDLASLNVQCIVKLADELAAGKNIDEEKAAKDQGVPGDQLRRAILALTSFFFNLPAESLKPEDAIALLASKAIIPKKFESALKRLIREISSKTSLPGVIRDKSEEKIALAPALPQMRGVWTRCLLVARYEPEYKADDEVHQYTPKVQRFIPVVSLQIDVDVFGTLQRFSVGLTHRELVQTINRLRLAEKQLQTLLAGAEVKPSNTSSIQRSRG